MKKHAYIRRVFFIILAENRRFELRQDLHPLTVFETAPFNRLGNSPVVVL